MPHLNELLALLVQRMDLELVGHSADVQHGGSRQSGRPRVAESEHLLEGGGARLVHAHHLCRARQLVLGTWLLSLSEDGRETKLSECTTSADHMLSMRIT